MSLPHISNSFAGRNKLEPLYKSLFEVTMTIPEALKSRFGSDEAIITEHVKNISGLTTNNGVETSQQKFMGTTISYLNSKMDDTSFSIDITFTLNLKDGRDAYLYKLFRAWLKLGYDMETGETALKSNYCADWLKVSVGNRAGDIYREILFKDVMLTGNLEGLDDYDYEANDLQELTVHFKSDWAEEIDA